MTQNISQMTATGTFSDASTSNITNQVAWTISDTSIATIGGGTGVVAMANAGKIWGADVGVTATLAPASPGIAAMSVIASDSGSVAPLMPQQNNHWQLLGLSPWGAYGGCQEATGNLVLSGSAGYTLTSTSVATQPPLQFQVPVPGWLRNSVWVSGSGGRFAAGVGVGPDPSVTSMAMLGYVVIKPGGAGTQVFGLGAAAAGSRLIFACDSVIGHTGQLDFVFNANIRRVVGPLTTAHSSRVHPLLLVYNRTAAETWAFTDHGLTWSGSAPAQVDGTKMFGANNNFSASASMVYFASCTGSLAESYASVSGGANLLSSLGWNVTYRNCPPDSGTIRLPFTPYCWSLLGLRPWSAAYTLQEVTGTCMSFDVWVGTNVNGWTMTPSLNVTYRNAQAGWARRSIDIPTVTSARMNVTNNLIGSYTGSAAFLGYAQIGTVGGSNRSLLGGYEAALGAQFRVQYGAAGVPQLNCSGTVTTGVNDHRDGRVHPFLAVYDATNSRAKLYTDLEVITGSFGVLNQTPSIGLGAILAGEVAASASYMYFAVATGSVAVSLSDNGQASAFLKSLGWNPPW